jgi:hypothetical protein
MAGRSEAASDSRQIARRSLAPQESDLAAGALMWR